eukprot:4032100-Prorocentrum_lima.AAC.1
MQTLILKGETVNMKGSEGGIWLIRHHRRARRLTYHPDWNSPELSQFEEETSKAMFYEESKVEQQKRKKA